MKEKVCRRFVSKRGLIFVLFLVCLVSVSLCIHSFVSAQETQEGTNIVENTLYSADFEDMELTASADEIYQATGLTGNTMSRTVTDEVADMMYLSTPYTFNEGGAQAANLYYDTGSGGAAFTPLVSGKSYSVSMKIGFYGPIKTMTLGIKNNAGDTDGNSVIEFKPDVTVTPFNWTVSDFVTLNSSNFSDGFFTLDFDVKSTGSGLTFLFWMNVEAADVETANVAGTSGLKIADFKISDSADKENLLYNMADKLYGKHGALLTGDALWGATGIAGKDNNSVFCPGGGAILGKSLKAVYPFHVDGGWQSDSLYANASKTAQLKSDNEYNLSFDIRPFGRWNNTYFLIEHDFTGGNIAKASILFRSDGTYEVYKSQGSGTYASFDLIASSVIEYKGDGLFNVKLVLNGYDAGLYFYMQQQSNDAANANSEKDTGIIIDNIKLSQYVDLGTEYKTQYSRNFNNLAAGLVDNEIFHATGFATTYGTNTMSVENNAINTNQALKFTYKFDTTTSESIKDVYLDSNNTPTVSNEYIYKFSMKIKPFGAVEHIRLHFLDSQSNRKDVILKDGSYTLQNVWGTPQILKINCQYIDGVYALEIFSLGASATSGGSGNITNQFFVKSSDAAAANTDVPTGFYLDDYVFSSKVLPEPIGLNKTTYFVNQADNNGFVTPFNAEAIESVKLGDEPLVLDTDYTIEGKLLTIKPTVFASLEAGEHILNVTCDNELIEATLLVDNIPIGLDAQNNFAGMPNLEGGQASKDTFFQNSFMDPGESEIFTTEGRDGRAVKFVSPTKPTENWESLFQTNPNEGKCNFLNADIWHTVTTVIKPENSSKLLIQIKTITPASDLYRLELDLIKGKREDGGAQSVDMNWNINALGDGWYELKLAFRYGGSNVTDATRAYVQFGGISSHQDSAYIMDSIAVSSELVPYGITESAEYDSATGSTPFYLMNNYSFDINSIMLVEQSLTITQDYTISKTPNGNTRLDLTADFCAGNLMDGTLMVTTSKGNTLEFGYRVIDSTPIFEVAEFSYDKTSSDHVKTVVDLKDKIIGSITTNGVALSGTEYYIEADSGKLVFKTSYLKTLSVGTHAFTLVSSTGATADFSFEIMDSTPVFGEAVIITIGQSTDYTISVELHDQSIVAVILNNQTLLSADYSYSNGVLTIKANKITGLIAGEYTLTIRTVADASVTLVVEGVDPIFGTQEYTATKGDSLVMDIDLKGFDIIEVSVGGLKLNDTEYSYQEGKLTITKEIFEELSAGDIVIELVTKGGKASQTIALQDAEESGGCGSTISGAAGLLLIICLFVIMGMRKRYKKLN